MALINSVISWVIKKRIHQIELFIKYPIDVQNDLLLKLITEAQDTEWGKKYDYNNINNYDDYKNRVPVNTYDDLKPYINRLIKGEQNLLWPEKIKWFAKSSGTTSDKSKFIPISQQALEECHFKGGKDLLAIYCNNNTDTYIFDGKGLAIGGSRQFFEVNNDAFYGDLSAIIIENLPFWAEFHRTPELDIALMDEWESKIQKIAETTINDNVTNILGVPSWTLILLKKILEISGKKHISEVWPALEMFAHGGISFKPYKEQFKEIINKDIKYIETYNASEGFFGIQDRNNTDDMLLMLDYGIFYEFIKPEDAGKAFPDTYTLEQVETGKNYAILISTNAGLWRYLIGDTIKFTSLNPFRIHITGRTKNYINAFGEELIIDNAERALQIACEKTNAIINEYTAAPVYFSKNKAGAHEWLIEFITAPANIQFFAEVLDNALKTINSDYEAKRYRDLILSQPIIRSLPKQTFYKWFKQKGKLGGQHKVPRLNNDRVFLEEIFKIANL
ncbi:MAG: GH3 auxin-responsive promoter family protein [Bacteroidales bacterium]|nr:GH3 auxin-responsive promoter family protein [Bacteroidales bacterium]